MRSSNNVTCPTCGTLVTDKFCPMCGTPAPTVQTPPKPVIPPHHADCCEICGAKFTLGVSRHNISWEIPISICGTCFDEVNRFSNPAFTADANRYFYQKYQAGTISKAADSFLISRGVSFSNSAPSPVASQVTESDSNASLGKSGWVTLLNVIVNIYLSLGIFAAMLFALFLYSHSMNGFAAFGIFAGIVLALLVSCALIMIFLEMATDIREIRNQISRIK